MVSAFRSSFLPGRALFAALAAPLFSLSSAESIATAAQCLGAPTTKNRRNLFETASQDVKTAVTDLGKRRRREEWRNGVVFSSPVRSRSRFVDGVQRNRRPVGCTQSTKRSSTVPADKKYHCKAAQEQHTNLSGCVARMSFQKLLQDGVGMSLLRQNSFHPGQHLSNKFEHEKNSI